MTTAYSLHPWNEASMDSGSTTCWHVAQGPYIAGQYVTSADIALAPQLYVLQTALAYYKNWTNFEQFYPALNLFMKVYSHKYHLKTHARPSSQPNKKPPPIKTNPAFLIS